MKHRRSIDLVAGYEAVEIDRETLATLPQWYVIHAQCPACRHETMIDRRQLASRSGKDTTLAKIGLHLKCNGCGNRTGNQLLLGKLPRD
jgi:hypothetical protein